MPRFLVHHRHARHECGIAFGAFPYFVAQRSTATPVAEVQIP